jgi:hypothetical protein
MTRRKSFSWQVFLLAFAVSGLACTAALSAVATAQTGGGGGGGGTSGPLCWNANYYPSPTGVGTTGGGWAGAGLGSPFAFYGVSCGSGSYPGFTLTPVGANGAQFSWMAGASWSCGLGTCVPASGAGTATGTQYQGASASFVAASTSTYTFTVAMSFIGGTGLFLNGYGYCSNGAVSGSIQAGDGMTVTDHTASGQQTTNLVHFNSGTQSCSSSGTAYSYSSNWYPGSTYSSIFAFSMTKGSSYTIAFYFLCSANADKTSGDSGTYNQMACALNNNNQNNNALEVTSASYSY